MVDLKTFQITKDQNGREIVMVRVDKTAKDLMEEKPFSRWDPEYWHPNSQGLLEEISSEYDLKLIGDLVAFITYGQVGKRIYDENGDVDYIQTINLQKTGIDYEIKRAKIKADSHNDPARSRLKRGDLLLGNSGMGGLGKVAIFSEKTRKVNISQDIDILRFNNINQYYVAVYLKTKFGNKQIWSRSKGVGAPKISFAEIKAIKIPVLPNTVQSHIEAKYKKMSFYHEKAMGAKERHEEIEYKKNAETANRIHDELIALTEAVIIRKRKDII